MTHKKLIKYILSILAGAIMIAGCKGIEPYHNPRKDIRMSPDDPISTICANGLPVIFLDTPNNADVPSKDTWMKDVKLTLITPDGSRTEKKIKIKGHGNGTWRNYPKKPYTFVFKKPTSILGMNPGRRFVLLANWRDRVLMRNAVALEISRKTSLDWTPDGRFVELVMNGQFLGNYYLTEKVNIEEGDMHVPVGNNGYLVNFDTGYDKYKGFITDLKKFPVDIKDPLGEDLTEEQRDSVKEYINHVEKLIYSEGSVGEDWHDILDIDSFCDWFLIHEITGNPEPQRPRSCYMHITSDGILHAGPCWDFDYETFIKRKPIWVNDGTLWFDVLLKDPVFKEHLKARWKAIEPALRNDIPKFIESTGEEIEESDELNHKMWPIVGWFDNRDEKFSFDKAVNKLNKNYLRRLDQIDKLVEDL